MCKILILLLSIVVLGTTGFAQSDTSGGGWFTVNGAQWTLPGAEAGGFVGIGRWIRLSDCIYLATPVEFGVSYKHEQSEAVAVLAPQIIFETFNKKWLIGMSPGLVNYWEPDSKPVTYTQIAGSITYVLPSAKAYKTTMGGLTLGMRHLVDAKRTTLYLGFTMMFDHGWGGR